MPEPEFYSVYITTGSREEAYKIAQVLVEEDLAPCANVFAGVMSVFRWKGKIERAEEVAIFAKTTADRFEALKKRVKQLHSYECPCIVATPIVAGNDEYLEWLRKG